jgi:hypothetical protein
LGDRKDLGGTEPFWTYYRKHEQSCIPEQSVRFAGISL